LRKAQGQKGRRIIVDRRLFFQIELSQIGQVCEFQHRHFRGAVEIATALIFEAASSVLLPA
jgi:hypothetical protein